MFFDDDRLQLAGPIAVIGAVAGAQLSAHALASWPTCSLFWYLNLEVFRCFRDGFEGLAGQWLAPDGLAQSLFVAVPLVGLIATGLLFKYRLPLAIASHLALLYSGLMLSDIGLLSGSAMSDFIASLLWAPASLLAVTIFFGSLFSAAMSHRIYWREILLRTHDGPVASYFASPNGAGAASSLSP
jgi:hypothetical protein